MRLPVSLVVLIIFLYFYFYLCISSPSLFPYVPVPLFYDLYSLSRLISFIIPTNLLRFISIPSIHTVYSFLSPSPFFLLPLISFLSPFFGSFVFLLFPIFFCFSSRLFYTIIPSFSIPSILTNLSSIISTFFLPLSSFFLFILFPTTHRSFVYSSLPISHLPFYLFLHSYHSFISFFPIYSFPSLSIPSSTPFIHVLLLPSFSRFPPSSLLYLLFHSHHSLIFLTFPIPIHTILLFPSPS